MSVTSVATKVLILAEHDGQHLKISTRQVVTAARLHHTQLDLLIVGHQKAAITETARTLSGVNRVLVVDAPYLAQPLAEDVAPLIAALGDDYQAIYAAHSAFAKNVLPRAAALLDVAMLTDVIEFMGDNTYVRPIYAGNLQATVWNDEPIQVLTVRGSRFPAAGYEGDAEVVQLSPLPPNTRSRLLETNRNSSSGPELGSARYVVSGGRALGSAERFESLLSPLAGTLGAALGATRAAVDAGYAPNDFQVGQTGSIVAPDCYFAVGISGAIQHTAGMKDSKIVVAINQDPDAPIFQVADYGLVADLFEAIPALSAALRQ